MIRAGGGEEVEGDTKQTDSGVESPTSLKPNPTDNLFQPPTK
jgi:hypothetical protein